MKKLLLALALQLGLGQQMVIPAAVGFTTAVIVSVPTEVLAGQCVPNNSVVCKDPTAVQKGAKVPVWKVAYCVLGPAGGPYTKIGCQDPRAVHIAPTGNEAVCFVGTDNKIHWDYQREVLEGRPFINHLMGGRWQPDWQSPPPY